MMMQLRPVKQRAASREWVIIGTHDAIVWGRVTIDNEAEGAGV